MTCKPVSLSNAPVGSSARMILGSPSDRNALHLPAAQLIGTFAHLRLQPDPLQCGFGTRQTFGLAHARKGKRKRDVVQHTDLRNEVVTLKHKSDLVVAVVVPIGRGKVFGAYSIHYQIARSVPVQSADYVEHGRFAAAARTQHGNEFARTKVKRNFFERVYGEFVVDRVVFCYVA